MDQRFTRLKRGCYTYGLSTAVLINLSPVLFLTLRNLYGISYGALGALIAVNFLTQLGVDLVFSFFPEKFDIPKVVKAAPLVAASGLAVYGLWPVLSPATAYLGLLLGTVIFSLAGGLAEVLLSPVIAAIPSPDPDREMSKLHSAYAWGVGPVVLICTAFLHFFGRELWYLLPLLFNIIPLASFLLLWGAEFPDMEAEEASADHSVLKSGTLWLGVAIIFLGGAAENTMGQWGSGYLEAALGIPKVFGDIFGVVLYALMLGGGRTLYTKYGRNLEKILFFGSIGAALCYIAAALCPIPAVGLAACALTGLFTCMLWPGSLSFTAERLPNGGVMMYALMAAGGDLGTAVVPQLIGIITDWSIVLFPNGGEGLGMKLGMLLGALCPIAAAVLIRKLSKREIDCKGT